MAWDAAANIERLLQAPHFTEVEVVPNAIHTQGIRLTVNNSRGNFVTRRVFFSFHFDNDYWRTQQIRNIGALEGQSLCTPNAWEEVKRKGDSAIEKWIADNMHGKSCVVVLVGSETASRRWVRHEIVKAWNDKRGVVGIRVDRLLDRNSQTSVAGANPFDAITFGDSGPKLSSVVQLITPTGNDSKGVYASISNNIERWIEEAIAIRSRN
ncbi:TIR domain-containing protein [Frateuria terrea]|uniref:TIR domain-containing protein n=1 Tax=Frateuria terrea TaxID=529704 RepID=UPI001FE223D7|nr:TIR domain-containing protein [Frateuria terrea]